MQENRKAGPRSHNNTDINKKAEKEFLCISEVQGIRCGNQKTLTSQLQTAVFFRITITVII